MRRIGMLLALAGPFIVAPLPGGAASSDYPSKPIRILVGFQPGGGSDLLARAVGAKLTESWGQPVVTDNRSGAGGVIAMETTARAAPDGYTLQVLSGSQLTNAALFTKVAFDLGRAYTPVLQMTSQPYVLMLHPSVSAKSVPELLALARSKPGTLNYGSSGTGSSAHLGMEMLNALAGVRTVHVPYKGSGAALIDLLGGQIQMLLASAISATPHMKSGKLRALAVTSGKRFSMLPDLPTIAEGGVPGFDVTGWYGLVAPAGLPAPLSARLNGEVGRILQTPDMRQKLAADGAEAAPGTPAQFAALMSTEIAKWTKLVKSIGLKPTE